MRILTQSCLLLGAILLLQGCTTTIGEFRPQTEFIGPNKTVRTLGSVEASRRKVGIIFTRSFSPAEIFEAYDEALKSKPGAEFMVNFSEDTKTMFIPMIPINIVTYSLKGEAAAVQAK